MSERFDPATDDDIFNVLPALPPDKLMLANAEWKESWTNRSDAVNTTIGVILNPETGSTYRNPSVIRSVNKANAEINRTEDYSYLTSRGDEKFLNAAKEFIFGDDTDDIMSFQSMGGTGALSMTKDALLWLKPKDKRTLVLDPGWPNHQGVFGDTPIKHGFEIVTYPHADFEHGTYNHALALDALHGAPDGSVALFQVSGYNGDGLGRTHEQWDDVLEVAQSKRQTVVLDAAYMGLTGTIEEDSYAIHEARRRGLLTFAAVSFSKNMGLYNSRLGALFVANAEPNLGKRGDDQVERLGKIIADKVIRPDYSNPVLLFAEAGAIVLTEEKEAFVKELEMVRNRLKSSREELAGILGKVAPIIANGSGLFTTLFENGFTQEQVNIIKSHGVFPLDNARVNIGGVHPDKIPQVGHAILDAVSR